MECRRKQKPGPEDPEEGPLRIEVAEGRPDHDREHEHSGKVPGRHRSRQNGFDDGEGPLVRAPVLRVGGQTGPERRSRPGIGKMEENEHQRTRHRHARPVAAGQRRQRGDGRQLGKRRKGEHRTHGPGHPGPPLAAGGSAGARRERKQDKDHKQKKAEGLEVAAPSRLDHEQRRPGEEDQGPGNGASGAARHLRQQQTGRQVGEHPQHLERQQRPAGQRARREDHLGEGGVDGGDGRIVDARVPPGANPFEFRRVRGVQVGVDARQLHVSVPEVAVDVVGQKRNAGE